VVNPHKNQHVASTVDKPPVLMKISQNGKYIEGRRKNFTKEQGMTDRFETTKAIKDWDIPKSDLAQLADVLPPRVSDYISGKRIPAVLAARIENAVQQVVLVWTGLGVRIDITDEQGFKRALDSVTAAIAKVEAEDAPPTLRLRAVEQ
jgi:plasmid maintenance system antidote protein VapI